MVDDAPPVAKPSAFWGTILLAARVHATTAELWQGIRDAAAMNGVRLPADMFAQVNAMRAIATSIRTSGEAISAAGPEAALEGAMIGRQLYARGDLARSLAPAYHVRFELTTTTAEGQQTGWYTLEYEGALPATVGDLRYDVGTYADSLAGTYGTAVIDVGAIEVGEF